MGWQSIETAPKDTDVLISDGVVVGEARYWWQEGQYDMWLWVNIDPSDNWADPVYPTHWMPLPAPPAGEKP